MWQKIKMWSALATIHHGIGAGLVPYLASILITGSPGLPAEILLAAVITGLQTMGGFVMNRYFDQQGDLVRYESHLKETGEIAPRTYRQFADMKGALLTRKRRLVHPYAALLFALALFACSLILARPLPQSAQLLVVANAVLLLPYSLIKNHLGLTSNVIVAYLNASTILFAALAIQLNHMALWPLMLSFFAVTLAREIVKDIEDIEPDRANGRKTRVLFMLERHGRKEALRRLRSTYVIPLLILGAVMNTVSLIWLYRTAYWIVAAAVWGLILVSIKELLSLETIDGGTGVPQAIYKVEGVLYQVFVASLGGLLLGSIQIA
ncbi:MAG TPA: UbiA family prenyltransferase [Anaerolineae bacterium]|nr:UbiA family prenyltransferase [Anaerolineae bacterium]